jgi:hypothetical protein
VVLVCGTPAATAPHAVSSSSPADPLQPLAFLIGRWEGTSEGQPGSANVRREYTRILKFAVHPSAKPKRRWRARETYAVFSADEFEEIFELAEPGKDFELYSRMRLKRVP